jgi:hypothetical protein
VFAAKEFLDKELGKYDSWKEVSSGPLKSMDLSNRSAFQNLKIKGIGYATICKFLGTSWSRNMVQEALAVYRSVKEDEAIYCQ